MLKKYICMKNLDVEQRKGYKLYLFPNIQKN